MNKIHLIDHSEDGKVPNWDENNKLVILFASADISENKRQ